MAIYDFKGNKVSAASSGNSPIAGKKACLIGDSNTQYNANAISAYFAETYGCILIPNGTAGATWEIREGQASAVEKVDAMIAHADEATNLCTDYDIILIMMGTNCAAVGTVEDTSATTTTMCGAIRHCLEKLLYYYRKSKIGVILPPQRNEGNDGQLERNALIQQICAEYSVPTLDLNRGGQILGDSRIGNTSYYLDDGLHLGANGKIQFLETVGRWAAYGMWGSAAGAVDGKNTSDIPEYITTEISTVATTLKTVQEAHPKSMTFAFLTDHHFHYNNEHLVRHNLHAIDEIAKTCRVEFAAFGGDNLAENGNGTVALNKVKYFGNILRDYKTRTAVVMGNHDDNSLSGYQADTGKYLVDYAVPQGQFYANLYRRNENVWNIAMDANRDRLYFYIDLPAQQLRVIFLNVIDIPLLDDGSGNLVYTGNHDSGYSNEQLNWVVSEALNFDDKKHPEQWGVITVQHFTDCPGIADFSNGAYVQQDHGGAAMYNIFRAFKNRTEYSSVIADGDFPHSVSCDFTSAEAELICRVSGHTHADHHVIHNGILYLSTMSAGPNGVGNNQATDGNTYTKTPDTAEESAFDLITVDKGTKTLYLTRFGAGVDRVISWAQAQSETLETARIAYLGGYNNGTGGYVDENTFAYTETTSFVNGGPTIAKRSTIAGGLLRVDWDVDTAKSFNLNMYILDANGNPYKLAGYPEGGTFEKWSGENYEPVWSNPGTEKSWGYAVAPFSVQIPEGCTVMCTVRYTADAYSPNGSLSGAEDFQNWVLEGGVTFTVTK